MIRYYIQQRLGRLDFEEIRGEHCDIEKVRKPNEKISRADFCCVRRFSDCEKALVLANEEIVKEFMPKYAVDLRKQRKRAADYVREAAELCRKLATYGKMINTMVAAFEENKEAEWEADSFRIRYERHEEPTRTPRILTNIPFQIEQDAKWRYLISHNGEVQLTIVQYTVGVFEIFFEESEVVIKCCIAPSEKVWHALDPYDKNWSQRVPELPEVKLILADSPWRNAKADQSENRSTDFMNFGIKEVRPQYVAVWIPQWNLRQAFRYMSEADYESVHSWTWVKMTTCEKIRGALGKLFQRSHEVLYFFKRRDVEGSTELKALKEQEVVFSDQTKYGTKPLALKKWIKRMLEDEVI
eukprot:augustus_masked-scaffold_1-processed-gene-30.3-mRNA-1 protein AED:1.00 eAED:1.00 QI:0/-1/0/0/-1/1/1/0/354